MLISIVRTTTLAVVLACVSGANPCAAQPAPATSLPLVYVLSTGGTIAGQGASSTAIADYQSGAIPGADLVKAVPEIAQVARIKVEQIANVNSSDITIAHWLTLANRINAIYASDPSVAGVVITHGTNTLEETAYFLNLTVKHERPVVLVGSMRPASAISADGPLNLLNAVRTAVAPQSRGRGVLVVLNDTINAARDVTKTNTYRVETFKATELGVLGFVDADAVTFYRSTTRRHTASSEFDVTGMTSLPPVDILLSYVQPSPILAKALVDAGVKGIVLAGTGAGLLSIPERQALEPFTKLPEGRRPVLVRSSRVGNGRVIPQKDYDVLDIVPADNLNPQKARVLLMLALTRTQDPKVIARMFAEY